MGKRASAEAALAQSGPPKQQQKCESAGPDAAAVPTVRQATAHAQTACPRWQDPGNDGVRVETYQTMKILVPWVRQELPGALTAAGLNVTGKVEKAHPLRIIAASTASGSALSNYKEAWNPQNCATAIKTTNMYEAGANLMWLSLGFVGDAAALLHAEPEWATVISYQKQFFSRSVGSSTPEIARILFPCVLEAYCDDEKLLTSGSMPEGGMELLGGQAIVFAWYLAAARALQAGDNKLLAILWQTTLTCTVRVKVAACQRDLAVASVELSEKLSQFVHMADTFVHWSMKVMYIAEDLNLDKKSAQVPGVLG